MLIPHLPCKPQTHHEGVYFVSNIAKILRLVVQSITASTGSTYHVRGRQNRIGLYIKSLELQHRVVRISSIGGVAYVDGESHDVQLWSSTCTLPLMSGFSKHR